MARIKFGDGAGCDLVADRFLLPQREKGKFKIENGYWQFGGNVVI